MWNCNVCCYPSNGGKVRGKRHGPEGSEVWITAQTNVSLERYLFKLMKDEKYQIIHMSRVGWILQITSLGINLFKVCLQIDLKKGCWQPRQKWLMTQHASTMDHTPTAICHSSEDRLLHYGDISRTSIR
jgi:hypothetical protein